MKEIPLTQGKVALIDDEDFEVVSKYKWYTRATGLGRRLYAARGSWPGSGIYMHRFLLAEYETDEVDHIDGNGLNNQRSNLRITTHSHNIQNQKKQRNTSSRFRGVCFNHSRRKWQANITKNYTTQHLGLFESEIEAAQAYDKKALELFGEGAAVNFPKEYRQGVL